MKPTRFFASLIVLLMLASTFAFAGGKQEAATGSGASGQPADMRFYGFVQVGAELELINRYIEWFQNQNPGVTVEYSVPQGNFHEALFIDFAAGTAPDVFSMGGFELEQYHSLGIVKNLTPFIEKDPAFNEADLIPAAYEYFHLNRDPNEDVYALSVGWSPYMLFFNKDMFEAAGLETPDVLYARGEWNLKTFLDAVRKLTKDLDGDGVIDQWGWQVPFTYNNMFDWIAANGVDELFGEDRLNYDDPKVKEVYRLIHDLEHKERIIPRREDVPAFEGFTLGTVAMLMTASTTIGRLQALNPSWEYGYTFIPKLERTHVFMYSNGIAINEKTKYAEQAWKFIRDYATGEGARLTAEYKLSFPMTKTHFELMNNDPIWIEAMQIARPMERHVRYGELRTIIAKHHNAFMEDPRADLNKMIDNIQKESMEILQNR